MRHWSHKYIGIPFLRRGRGFDGCDCGGLVLLVLQNELGLHATDFTAYETADFNGLGGYQKLAQGIEDLMGEWVAVKKPRPFDLCRFRYGRVPCHVGLYVGLGGFLHVEEAALSAKITPWADAHWRHNFMEFRRHKALL